MSAQVTGYEQNRGSTRSGLRQATESAQQVVEDRPIPTAVAVFGVGFGVGVLLGCALADARPISGSGDRSVEAFGHHMLDSLANLVPQAVSNHLSR